MNVREDLASMHIHAKIWLGTIVASAKRAGLERTVTITSMTVWGSANMELLALTWSMTTIVLVNQDTQVNNYNFYRTTLIFFVMNFSINPLVYYTFHRHQWYLRSSRCACFFTCISWFDCTSLGPHILMCVYYRIITCESNFKIVCNLFLSLELLSKLQVHLYYTKPRCRFESPPRDKLS